jgi:hypothetical protein
MVLRNRGAAYEEQGEVVPRRGFARRPLYRSIIKLCCFSLKPTVFLTNRSSLPTGDSSMPLRLKELYDRCMKSLRRALNQNFPTPILAAVFQVARNLFIMPHHCPGEGPGS